MLGIMAGLITGLIPALHINTVAVLCLALYSMIDIDPLLLSAFIVSMSTTHSFLDFIPSIFLSAPDPATALTVLPTHQMLFEGKGYIALALSVIGGLAGMMILVCFTATLANHITYIYSMLRTHIASLLIFSMAFIILKGRRKKETLAIFFLSGMLGKLTLDCTSIDPNFLLFPLFTGLFGISNIMMSLGNKTEIPKQKTTLALGTRGLARSSSAGFLGGLVAGTLPGLGSSQSAMLLQDLMHLKDPRSFIIAVGAIGTIDIVLSFLSIYLIGNARSGVAIAVQNMISIIDLGTIGIFIGISMISAGISSALALMIGKKASVFVTSIDYRKAGISMIVFMAASVMLLTGLIGTVILATSTGLGILCQEMGVRRSILMGCLIIPTIIFFASI